MAKGAGLEELVRAYFASQGFVALRSVPIQFENEDVTDVDVWIYGRQGGGVRTRSLVDVKDKKSPKAFERVMWTRGLQLALGCDRAIVATTDNSPKAKRFALQHKVVLLTAGFLRHWADEDFLQDRLTLEEFLENIQSYPAQKQDGDWVKQIASAKSAAASLAPYPAFNKALSSFRFFAERAATRPHHREQALRGAFLSAGLACMALDAALAGLAFEDPQERYRQLYAGVTYGDAGDGRVKHSIDTVLNVMASGMKNGRVLARQTSDAFHQMFADVRAEIIAEFFGKEQNAALLFKAARELEMRAHMRSRSDLTTLNVEVKSIIGVFADFAGVKRPALLSTDFEAAGGPSIGRRAAGTAVVPQSGPSAVEEVAEDPGQRNSEDPNPKLL
ncbi:hypothetical protein ASD00_19460 [Ensifer sp. Root31]|uniref:restriction endonuclease n=1 Tax=Ensifer sp. Root31 TaxID=1736512 RepID=UPI0007089E59|nr:restriction endonuclease [Ensifer sp. Root31]KQU97006.1 hypothetical protein ASD00_19460 [Ensifer sp. Root31]